MTSEQNLREALVAYRDALAAAKTAAAGAVTALQNDILATSLAAWGTLLTAASPSMDQGVDAAIRILDERAAAQAAPSA
jgi:hypothetical protein